MVTWRDFLLVGVGAVLGANLRYLLTVYSIMQFGTRFPYGTLFINISGSFLLGLLLALVGIKLPVDPGYRLMLGTGFLGAYTTFSTFSYDNLAMLQRGELMPVLVNAMASVFGSVLAAYAGIVVARLFT